MNRNASTRTAAKKTATAKAVKEQVAEDSDTDEQDAIRRVFARYENAREELLKALKAPTWKRMLAGFVASTVVAAGIGWMLGMVLDFLVLGILTLTGSFYAGMVVWILGIIAIAVAGGIGAMRAWDSVMSGKAETAVRDAWIGVKGFFKREDKGLARA